MSQSKLFDRIVIFSVNFFELKYDASILIPTVGDVTASPLLWRFRHVKGGSEENDT